MNPATGGIAQTELGFIGGILCATNDRLPAVWGGVVESGLTAAHFDDPALALIYAHLVERVAAGQCCLKFSVTADARAADLDDGKMEEAAIAGAMPEELPLLARQIVEAARCRALTAAIRDAADDLKSGVEPDEAARRIRELGEPASALPVPVNAAAWSQEDVEPPRQLVEGVLDAGAKALIVGPSKCRKSFFALQLAVALASGRNILGMRVPSPARVLLWQAEVPPAHYHARLCRMMEALGVRAADLADRLQLVHGRGFQFANRHGPDLVRMVKRVASDVVILDPAYRFLEGNESDPEAVRAFLRMLDAVAEAGCTTCTVHHAAKGQAGDRQAIDRASGSGYWARDFDAQLSLTPHREDGLIVLETICRSYAPHDAVSLAFTGSCFETSDAAPVVRTSQNGPRGRAGPMPKIDDAAAALGDKTATFSMLIARLRSIGFSRDGAREALDTMVTDGRAVKWREPRAGGPVHYGTPEAVHAARERFGKAGAA